MKKTTTLLVSIFLLVSLISCGNEKKSADNNSAEEDTKWFMAQTDNASVVNISASSELVEAQYAGNYLYPPINIIDGDLNTTWCEADENGSGIGETITIELSQAVSFDEIQIVNGFASKEHPDYYKKNNRVKSIQLTQVAGEHFQNKQYTLADDTPDYQSINFELPQTAQFITIQLLDVYRGDKYDDTCLDDLRLLYQGKIIPFTNVDSLKTLQEENSKEMLNQDFDEKFKALFHTLGGRNHLLLKRVYGKDMSGIYMSADSDFSDFEYKEIDFAENGDLLMDYWAPEYYNAKIQNCKIKLSSRVDYVTVTTTKLIKIKDNIVNINGVDYKIVKQNAYNLTYGDM